MTKYGTIKIPRDEYERHNERRQELGQEWVEYIDGQAPDRVDETEIARYIVEVLREANGGDLPPVRAGPRNE